MTRMALLLWLGVLCLLGGNVGLAAAQVGSVRQEVLTGDYLVRIRTNDGSLGDVRVPAKNRVVSDVAVALSGTVDGLVRYEYWVRVQHSSPQDLLAVDFTCPAEAGIRDLEGTKFTVKAGRRLLRVRRGEGECSTVASLAPGDSATITFAGTALPSLARVALIGASDVPQWPCECWGDPENEPAMAAIDTLDGTRGGGATALVLSPMRPPTLLATPVATLLHLQSDLWLVCGPLTLITNPGICASLRAKLDAAGEAIARGNANGARGPLGAFVNELNAQQGKAVPPLAFSLLSFYAQRLSQQLTR